MISGSEKLAEFRNDLTKTCPARKRLTYLFDEGEYTEIDSFTKSGDDICGVITAFGYVEGSPVYAFSQDKTVKSGAVNNSHARKISKLFEMAAKTGSPIVGIHDSNGAFIDGGIDALSAYGEMIMWTSNISGVVPQIAVIVGTCAGSGAMLACSSDFVIMTEDSEFFMTPPFNSDKNNGAGTAAAAEKSGTASLICKDDAAAMENARKLVSMLPMNNLSPVPMFEFSENETLSANNAYELVTSIADKDSIMELSSTFGTASFIAFGTMGGSAVGFVATNKTDDLLTSDDCAKIARFMRTCDAFAIPMITLVDTEGFLVGEELTGSIRHMTQLAHSYAEATTVKIAVVTGKAYGPAFIALAGKSANSDMTFAFPDAVITPLSPLTAAEFLYHDKLKGAADVTARRLELADEYAKTEVSAFAAAEKNCIDDIILLTETRKTILATLDVLAGKRVSRLPKKHSNMPF